MKRRQPIIERLIRVGCRPSPRAVAAQNRAIDAVLGKRVVKKAARNITAEVEQQFREAKHGST